MRWSNNLALFCCYCCFAWLLVIYVFCFRVCSFFKFVGFPLVYLNFLNIHLVWLWDDQTPLLYFVVIAALTKREWHNPCFVLVQPNKARVFHEMVKHPCFVLLLFLLCLIMRCLYFASYFFSREYKIWYIFAWNELWSCKRKTPLLYCI